MFLGLVRIRSSNTQEFHTLVNSIKANLFELDSPELPNAFQSIRATCERQTFCSTVDQAFSCLNVYFEVDTTWSHDSRAGLIRNGFSTEKKREHVKGRRFAERTS